MPEAADNPRRRKLRVALKLGLLGLLAGFVWIALPSLDQIADNASDAGLRVELRGIEPGQARQLLWQSRPVWIVHRDPRMLAALAAAETELSDPHSTRSSQPDWARQRHRSREPRWLIVIGVGTDLGCPLVYLPASAEVFRGRPWAGGFRDSCGGSRYDAAGRVFADQPAKHNLRVPPYRLESGWLQLGR